MHSFQPKNLILGSASPRRKALLEAMGLEFELRQADMEESYPEGLTGHQITDYLARQKATILRADLDQDSLLLTADTVVWFNNSVLEKPADMNEAQETLRRLSGQWHEVITSVCFTRIAKQLTEHAVTSVKFTDLSEQMIDTYLQIGHPLDKAGAYGIQEWIGLVGVETIRGSYTNVVGLPTELVYKTLRTMVPGGN